jgi:hypothetical protein
MSDTDTWHSEDTADALAEAKVLGLEERETHAFAILADAEARKAWAEQDAAFFLAKLASANASALVELDKIRAKVKSATDQVMSVKRDAMAAGDIAMVARAELTELRKRRSSAKDGNVKSAIRIS